MNDLCADIGYKSINHHGEELCGDHIDVVVTTGSPVYKTCSRSIESDDT